jgi:aminomethyltransferase
MDKAGGFVGRDALIKRRGNESHRLVGLLIDGKRIPRAEMRVQHEGRDVGWVTSGTRSPSRSQGIALAYVERSLGRVGTELSIDVRGREAPCRVVKGAFHKNL